MSNASVQFCDASIGRTVPMNSAGFWRADILYVLLVEDDDVDARLIDIYAASMRIPRVVIERAVSATEALRLLAEWSFDLCILDFWLGCESSLRLLAELAGLDVVPPTIVLTSLSTPDIHRMCQRAGATSFVGKENLTPVLLESAIHDALWPTSPSKPLPENGEEAMVRLLTRLLHDFPPAPLGADGTPRSEDWLRARSAMRRQLGSLLEMTETVRFGLFEKVLADHGPPAMARGGAWIDDVSRFMAAAVEIARGVIDCRGQTLVFHPPPAAVGAACDPPTLMFLMFELVIRASQQSANNSQIRVWLRADADALRIGLASEVPVHANAGAVAFGPLFAQMLGDLQGLVGSSFGSDGQLNLDVSFNAMSSDRPSSAARLVRGAHFHFDPDQQ